MAEREGTQASGKQKREPLDPTQAGIFTNFIGAALGGFWLLLAGSCLTLRFPLNIIFLSADLLFGSLAAYYFYVLGGVHAEADSPAFARYHALRMDLSLGGSPGIVYQNWLEVLLDRVDRFFGDAQRSDRSWFARLLGLQTPGARWTAPAFERCLLLSATYNVTIIFAVWAITGQAGIAGGVLGLRDAASGFSRAVASAGLIGAVISFQRVAASKRWRTRTLFALIGLVCSIVPDFESQNSVLVFFPFIFCSLFSGAVLGLSDIESGEFVVSLCIGMGVLHSVNFVGGLALVVAIIGATVSARAVSENAERLGQFLAVFTAAAFVAIFAASWFLSRDMYWSDSGEMMLMFGLLPLINAPFDWFALGLTRALLRRGLAPGGWGPFPYATIDAVASSIIILILALCCVVLVQSFDDLVTFRAGSDAAWTFPMTKFFQGINAEPGAKEYYWVWFMLFSTMIPSILRNLCISF